MINLRIFAVPSLELLQVLIIDFLFYLLLQAKQRASVKWLLSKAYNNRVPENLREPYYVDNEVRNPDDFTTMTHDIIVTIVQKKKQELASLAKVLISPILVAYSFLEPSKILF